MRSAEIRAEPGVVVCRYPMLRNRSAGVVSRARAEIGFVRCLFLAPAPCLPESPQVGGEGWQQVVHQRTIQRLCQLYQVRLRQFIQTTV